MESENKLSEKKLEALRKARTARRTRALERRQEKENMEELKEKLLQEYMDQLAITDEVDSPPSPSPSPSPLPMVEPPKTKVIAMEPMPQPPSQGLVRQQAVSPPVPHVSVPNAVDPRRQPSFMEAFVSSLRK